MKDILTFCTKKNQRIENRRNGKHRTKSENHSREQHISKSTKHNEFQSKHQRSLLKTAYAKKRFNQLKYGPMQTQQCSSRNE